MQEHQLLQNQMVQPLQHVLYQDEVEQEGGYVRYEHSKELCASSNEKESTGRLKRPTERQRHQHNCFF